ncbi:hypothetical protein RSSM_06701 [Rhodopirellula sallentina SM41]|uniref:Uncharacterized protein n=1 Tax=Rhodopirellula sallentina SM41 TaxID=1263870 RepID=M5TS38_9BACT|nr:hypothetical protein RSSM_06701 [Rhodopirellula sallentina SM41]
MTSGAVDRERGRTLVSRSVIAAAATRQPGIGTAGENEATGKSGGRQIHWLGFL